MKLNVQYKKKLTKTDKQKKANAEKKKKGPKLMNDYMDNSACEHDNIALDITKMKYGTISSCDCDAIITADGTINVKNSWLEVLLIMLDTIITNNPDSFGKLFEENEVTSMFFVVDKVYGKYSFDKLQYKAYKIFDSGYYLEYVNTSEVVFKALVGCIKCMGLPLDQIQFHLRNKVYSNLNLRFDILEETESIVTVDELPDMLKAGIHMTSINILGEIIEVHRIDVALVAFCNVIFDKYGILKMSMIPSSQSTGVKILEDGDELNHNIMSIRESELGVYTDGDSVRIVEFIRNALEYLEIDKQQVKFKFKALKEKSKLKEWEID
jgi:hypothetical protein